MAPPAACTEAMGKPKNEAQKGTAKKRLAKNLAPMRKESKDMTKAPVKGLGFGV